MTRWETPGPVQIKVLALIAEKGFWHRRCGWNVTGTNGARVYTEDVCMTLCARQLLVFTKNAAGDRVYTLPGKAPANDSANSPGSRVAGKEVSDDASR